MPSFLLDTHILLWTTFSPAKLSAAAQQLLTDPDHELYFSTISLWEVAIKFARNKPDFVIDPAILVPALLRNGLREMPLTSAHVLATVTLPGIHKDPFDRILIAQANLENMQLLTVDSEISRYPGSLKL